MKKNVQNVVVSRLNGAEYVGEKNDFFVDLVASGFRFLGDHRGFLAKN
jgi:hypothetical protein